MYCGCGESCCLAIRENPVLVYRRVHVGILNMQICYFKNSLFSNCVPVATILSTTVFMSSVKENIQRAQ